MAHLETGLVETLEPLAFARECDSSASFSSFSLRASNDNCLYHTECLALDRQPNRFARIMLSGN